MLRGPQIKTLVDLFNERGVYLYHSCQFVDFQSYLELGGIPSRKKLTQNRKKFTKFESDKLDQTNGVWDKVFLNPCDLGEIFEKGNGVPTVYGPIHFLVRPEAFLEASDVAFALRSAGSPNFNRDTEALKSVDEINRVFRHPCTVSKGKRKEIKWVDELKQEFNKEHVSNPEISISYSGGVLPISFVAKIKVDTYFFKNDFLYNHLAQCSKIKSWDGFLKNYIFRKYEKPQRIIIDDITKLLLKGVISIGDLLADPTIATETIKWANKLKEKGIDNQWDRYSKYLREGTFMPILRELEKENKLLGISSMLVTSDWGLYSCLACNKMVLGYEKENHERENHKGKKGDWKKLR